MPSSTVTRANDAAGTSIRTFADSAGVEAQGVVPVDGDHAELLTDDNPGSVKLVDAAAADLGTASNPLVVNDVGASPGASSPLTSRDVWGRQLVVQPFSLLGLIFSFGIDDDRVRATETGAGTVTSIDGSLRLSVSQAGDAAILRSKTHPSYQPNRGHVFSTATQGVPAAVNVETRLGMFSSRYGVMFRITDSAIYAVVRNTTGNTDPGDFSQGGGTTVDDEIDVTAAALAALGVDTFNEIVDVNRLWDIRFQWRGSGDVEFYIDQHLVATTNRLGVATGLSMAVPSQPARVQVAATGLPAGTSTAQIGCIDVSSEGGKAPSAFPVVAQREGTALAISSETPWIAVKAAPNLRGLSHTRDMQPLEFQATADNETIVRAYRNPTLTGGTWSEIPGAPGFVQRTPTGFSGGQVIGVSFLSDNDLRAAGPPLDLRGSRRVTPDEDAIDLDDATDDGDILLITVESTSGNVNEIVSALLLEEEL